MCDLSYELSLDFKCKCCGASVSASSLSLYVFGDRNLLSARSKTECEKCGFVNVVGGLVRNGDSGFLKYQNLRG